MIKLIITVLISSFCTVVNSQTTTIIVNVNGIQSAKGGKILVGFFTKENYLVLGKENPRQMVKVTSPALQLVFENVPRGEYAISAFQDINDNNKLDRNFLGIPTEPYGFSNNATAIIGPPTFDEAKILTNISNTIAITLK